MSELKQLLQLIKRPKPETPAENWKRMLRVLQGEPGTALPLAKTLLDVAPRGGNFLVLTLAHLSEEEFTQVLEIARARFERGESHQYDEVVIAHASLQFPHLLTAHLAAFRIRPPNERAYYSDFPWRAAGEDEIAVQFSLLVDERQTLSQRHLAWSRLLQTRRVDIIRRALSLLPSLPDIADRQNGNADDLSVRLSRDAVIADLQEVGFNLEGDALYVLDKLKAVFHSRFPDTFLADPSAPPWLGHDHPTWHLASDSSFDATFGGLLTEQCGGCARPLQQFLVFSHIPPLLSVSSLDSLTLATCLACLGWEQEILFYGHDTEGIPHSFNFTHSRSLGLPVKPLRQCKIILCPTPPRWRAQDWGLSLNENLNRVGGAPCWIQHSAYPDCPRCGATMPLLAQFDSGLPTEEGQKFDWGSGGLGYTFWCDACRISAWLSQCT